MEERNPIAVVFMGLFKVVKFVVLAFVWVIVIAGVLTKNR